MATVISWNWRWSPGQTAAAFQPSPLAATVAQRAITIVRDRANLIPIRQMPPGGVLVVSPMAPPSSPVVDHDPDMRLATAVRRYVPDAEELLVPIRPSAGEIQAAARRAAQKGLVVLATYDAWAAPGGIHQQDLVRAVLATGTPTVVVGLRTPYDLLVLGEVPTYVAAYSDRPVALQAVASVLFGSTPARGRLPVDLQQVE